MRINLDSLAIGIPAMTLGAAYSYKEKCMVCFDNQGHGSGVTLTLCYNRCSGGNVISRRSENIEITWSGNVTDQLRRGYADLNRTTEDAACAIAVLLIRELTEFTVIRQAQQMEGFDYHLGFDNQDESLIFNGPDGYLEVSGILREDPSTRNTVENRMRRKKQNLQSRQQEHKLPVFIIVVEFSNPRTKVVEL